MRRIKVKKGQQWADRKTGHILTVIGKNGDKWNCKFNRGRVSHGMTEFTLNKWYIKLRKTNT